MVNKKELRQQIRTQKRAMTEAQIEEKSRVLGEKFRACPCCVRHCWTASRWLSPRSLATI